MPPASSRRRPRPARNTVCLQGDIRLIRDLIFGQWNEQDYLIVPPGRTIDGVYDHEQVIRVK